MKRLALAALVAALSATSIHAQAAVTPVGDFHQHVFSPAATTMLNLARQVNVELLIPLLDSAGIEKAVLLSVAYMYGSPTRTVEDEYAKVRAENDWTAAEAAKHPARLSAFCSVNPLKPYALEEIARCGRTPGLRNGLKLHFGNSDIRLDSARQVDVMKRVFRAANENKMAITVHMHANTNGRPYGVAQGRTFLEQLLPEAPDIVVQIAHFGGAGGAASLAADSVMGVFADAIAKNDPRMKNVWFDMTSVADSRLTPEQAQRVVNRMRQVGMARLVYGSDAAITPATAPKNGWAYFLKLPLTEQELRTVATNVPPYMR